MTRQKSLFNKNLFFEDIKQNKHIMILYTVFLLLATTLPAMISYSAYLEDKQLYIIKDAAELLCMSNPFVTFLNCGAALIFVILQFGYLYKTNSVIFYHSMPLTRQNLIITKFLSGFLCMFIPIILAFLVNASINIIIGFQYLVSISEMIKILCSIILTTLFTYSVITFAQTLCSNVFALVISVAFIFLLYPITKLVAVGTFVANMPTYSISMKMPLADYIYPMWITFTNDTSLKMFTAPFAIYLIIVPIVLITLSAVIYSKRKSENTNKFFAFDVVNKFLKYYITICLTFGVGTIIRSNVNSMNLIISFVVHIVSVVVIFSILQAIFDKNIKNMFANKKQMAIICVFILLVVTALEVDIFKIDKMVPDVNKTEEITVRIPLATGENIYHSNEEITLKNKESMQKAINLLKLGEPSKNRGWTGSDDVIHIRLTTPNYDKLGITREFLTTGAEFENFYAFVFDTKEYKDQVYDLTDFDPADKYSIHVGIVDEKNGGANYFYLESDSDKTYQFVNLLKEESNKVKYADIKDDKVVFVVDYQYKVERNGGGWNYIYRNVPIFEGFKETINLLNEIYEQQNK